MATFRFKIRTPQLEREMVAFAAHHQYETRNELKKKYEAWLLDEDIALLVQEEKEIMERMDYKTLIEPKIYKSIKYYHIKKELGVLNDNAAKKKRSPVPSKKAVLFSQNFRGVAKNHILEQPGMPPAKSFEQFQTRFQCAIEIEQRTMPDLSEAAFLLKLKKMYKNQCYTNSN
jgi:hypothetical protein